MVSTQEHERVLRSLDDLAHVCQHVLHTVGTLVTAAPEATNDDRAAIRLLRETLTDVRANADRISEVGDRFVERCYEERAAAQNERNGARAMATTLTEALIALVAIAEQRGLRDEPALTEARRVAALGLRARRGWRRSTWWFRGGTRQLEEHRRAGRRYAPMGQLTWG